MTIRQYVWLNGTDTLLKARVRSLGVNNAARAAGCCPGHISRWLSCQVGLEMNKFQLIIAALPMQTPHNNVIATGDPIS